MLASFKRKAIRWLDKSNGVEMHTKDRTMCSLDASIHRTSIQRTVQSI